jgi:dihydropteroate synthase
MQALTDYTDVTEDVAEYFRSFSEKAAGFGIKKWVLDPGFGFAKTLEQNYQMLCNLDTFKSVVCADGSTARLLVGVSRKSMIYKPLGISPEDALPATQAVHMAALIGGADMLRVHDVKEARQTADLFLLQFC